MRTAKVDRVTAETEIHLTLSIEGRGQASVDTGLGFLDHMLTLFAHHGLFDLAVVARGDLHVDAASHSRRCRHLSRTGTL